MATPRGAPKPVSAQRHVHRLTVAIDGTSLDIDFAAADEAERIAEAVLQAAQHRATVHVPVGQVEGSVIVRKGDIVLDFANVQRTATYVTAQPLPTGAGNFKR